jgi:pyruvate formate lyase activating enzyme
VFYEACSFDCLFCQNWHFRERSLKEGRVSAGELAAQVNDRTTCICYFGGDPAPQIAHSLAASRKAVESREGKALRICWETNGSMHPGFLEQMIDISLETGGCIKFDLKAWNEELHKALCGVSNGRTIENFRSLAEKGGERPEPPLAVASTLLVPGYIDEEEVSGIAGFIASLDRRIPYSLLAFSPQYQMYDLPTTSNSQAEACYNAAKDAGLERVKLGNVFLLDAII